MDCISTAREQLTDEYGARLSSAFHLSILKNSLDFFESALTTERSDDAFAVTEWHAVLQDARDALNDLSNDLA